jgi:SAM-dependent methyltransferase
LKEYREVRAEQAPEHIEEDLESARVVALYLMNHFLRVNDGGDWWKPKVGSPLVESLIQQHWDHGPFSVIRGWLEKEPAGDVVELGCGAGGLAAELSGTFKSYLGVDASFASVASGRHLLFGAPFRGELKIPGDLLPGPLSVDAGLKPKRTALENADLVVGDLDALPLASGQWDLSILLNAIDMVDDPASLPGKQAALVKPGHGRVVQSCPYIWHPLVSRRLRKVLPKDRQEDSARAVEWLYQQAGFQLDMRVEQHPWLFYKHRRQLELYSVHLFHGRLGKRG